MKNKSKVELSNIEIFEHCILDIETGEKEYNKEKKLEPYFTGSYYKNDDIFFAIYPSSEGPVMYYEGIEYLLKKDLDIQLDIKGDKREFSIREYNIFIEYNTSKYIEFDPWSDEEDIDLFYQIWKLYKTDEYYSKFTNI